MFKFGQNGGQGIFLLHGFRRVFHYTTSATNAGVSTFMVDYLMDCLGFTKQEAIITASKVRPLKSTAKPDSVVDFLKSNGFNKTHVKKLVYSLPMILSSKVDKTLKPKLEVFQKLGLGGSGLADVVCGCPDILRRSLDGHLIPTLDALKTVFRDNNGDNLNIVRALKTSSWMLAPGVQKNLPLNVALLRSYGLSDDQVKLLVCRRARYILLDHEWLQAVLIRVEEKLGIPRESAMFFHGICALCSSSEESMESKFEIFKSYGWTESEILTVARKNPYVLVFSESKLRSKINFLMKELGYQPVEIARRACVLTYSFDKRVIPRYIVMTVLKEKKLIKPTGCFLSSLYMSDSKFFTKYVLPFKDKIPGLSDDYRRRVGLPSEAAK